MTTVTQPSTKHQDREQLAADIKGLSLAEHLEQKSLTKTRDPVDDFAAWHERFRHELESEFGELPDDEDSESFEEYILKMKKKFRLRLK
jgi:hypothetical protein